MEKLDIVYYHLVYLAEICFISKNFGIFCGYWPYFLHFGTLHQKLWQPWTHASGAKSNLTSFTFAGELRRTLAQCQIRFQSMYGINKC
jgi:hypothetical protein